VVAVVGGALVGSKHDLITALFDLVAALEDWAVAMQQEGWVGESTGSSHAAEARDA